MNSLCSRLQELPPVFTTVQPWILASGSPRRAGLLRSLGLSFEIKPSGADESRPHTRPEEQAQLWAGEKVQTVSEQYPDHWVLGADTIVVLGQTIYGKPRDPDEARLTLIQLSGRVHQVITGLCLARRSSGYLQTVSVCTRVRFKDLSEDEIMAYVATGEPLDKAGSYGIQSLGAFLVRSVKGSYTNVVGLPLAETIEWLMRFRIIAPTNNR